MKFQTGLKTCRNFEILPHGPAVNRSGFEYVLETKFSAKRSVLIPFIYNPQQTYQLEFGDHYVRFHTQEGTVLEAAQAITSVTVANPAVFTKVAHGYVTGEWLFFQYTTALGVDPVLDGRFMIVQVLDPDTYTLTDLAGAPFSTVGVSLFVAGTTARVYEIVSPYAEADLFAANANDVTGALAIHFVQSSDVLTLVHPSYAVQELRRTGATNWVFATVSFVPTQAAPTAPVATPTLGGATVYTYAVTALAANTLEESVQSPDATCANDLTTAGHSNLITWTNAAGAVRYNIYKKISGFYAFIGQGADGTAGFVDNNITPNATITPPIANDPISAANERPQAVGYYQGRRWFGGSNNNPQGLFATRSGTESNMGSSIPTQANDAINVRLTARQNSTIRHIVAGSALLVLTSSGEWQVAPSGPGPIGPANIEYHPEDHFGGSNVAPVLTSSALLYAQDRGGRVREMKFQWQQQGYRSDDISILAPHLFDGYRLTTMAYVRAPYPFVWTTRSDGVLLGLTYIQSQEVAAWHHHDTAGTFESVVSTPEGPEDTLYVIVKRSINGRDVRYVECLYTRQFGTLPYAFFVDAGLTYDGPPATVISGLWHLEGEIVSILADGAVLPQQRVTGGTITLEAPASVVSAGLPYVSDLETLPLAIEGQMAAAQGMEKNVGAVYLRLNESSPDFVGPSVNRLTEIPKRTTEPYGSPPALFSGTKKIVVNPAWNYDATICVRQTNPLPVTVLSMTLDSALGG